MAPDLGNAQIWALARPAPEKTVVRRDEPDGVEEP